MINLPRLQLFGHSITRECTLKAIEQKALNLSQGFPEEEPHQLLKDAAREAILDGPNQYADMRGSPALRTAIADYYSRIKGMEWVNADDHVTVTCGATEAMAAALLATAGPGDEVVIQEPSYENYPPQALLAGATIKRLSLNPPNWAITQSQLDAAFSPRTKLIILNNPNNPTGRVFTAGELQAVAETCERHNALVLSDEIYEHLVWDGRKHTLFSTLPGMAERTVTISGISKTFAATGWRIGWCVAPKQITTAIRRVHDFLTAAVPTPLQAAAAKAFSLPPSYYAALTERYQKRRALLAEYLKAAGLTFSMPEGAYYFFASCERLNFPNAVDFSTRLLQEGKVAVVPYTAFFGDSLHGRFFCRINFAKKEDTLLKAGERIVQFCRENLKR